MGVLYISYAMLKKQAPAEEEPNERTFSQLATDERENLMYKKTTINVDNLLHHSAFSLNDD